MEKIFLFIFIVLKSHFSLQDYLLNVPQKGLSEKTSRRSSKTLRNIGMEVKVRFGSERQT